MFSDKQLYSTTQLLIKLDGIDPFIDENGTIKDEYKFQINNSTFNIKNSKFPSKPDDKFETVLFLPVGEGRKGEDGLRTKGYLKGSYKLVDGEWYICDFNGEIRSKVPDDIRKKIESYIQSTEHLVDETAKFNSNMSADSFEIGGNANSKCLANNQSPITNYDSPTTNHQLPIEHLAHNFTNSNTHVNSESVQIHKTDHLRCSTNHSPITDLPLISIITVVFNGEKYLEQTIQSVINQTYPNVEYIIIDGGSSDGTLDIIRKYEHAIDYWVSERDRGISDAFNKGTICSIGRYLQFLNAGDFFLNLNTLQFCSFYLLEENFRVYSFFANFGRTTIPKKEITKDMPVYKKALISHQASFIRIDVFRKYGLYDLNFKLRMDYEFWLRVLKDVDLCFVSEHIIYYDENGISGSNPILFYNEELYANKKHLSKRFFVRLYLLIWIKKMIKSFIFFIHNRSKYIRLKKLLSFNIIS